MGKHEPMTAKAIANKIKAKGLQKIKYYCEMCKKQCRDDNGFKCHIMSESHQRQALIVCEDPNKFVNEFSKEFMNGFLFILKARYRTKRVLANTVFQDYIKERDHVHLNGTRWTTLTDFAKWLGDEGIVKVDDSERGVMVTYIDRDPETLKRQELEAKRAQQAKEAAERKQREIELQREAAKKILKDTEPARPQAEPIPIVKIPLDQGSADQESDEQRQIEGDGSNDLNLQNDSTAPVCPNSDSTSVIERPVFKVETFTLKPTTTSKYKPPPPKRRVTSKSSSAKKKSKLC